MTSRRRQGRRVVGSIINRSVNALPVQLHFPGYKFCRPGTTLSQRLAHGIHGINKLDEACREHDIAYRKYKDNDRGRLAVRILAEKAWQRVKAWNSQISGRAYAAAVAVVMKAKSAVGSSRKKKKTGKKKASGLYLRPYRQN